MLINNETKFPDIVVVRSIRSDIKIGVKVITKVALFAPKHVDIIELTCDMRISLLTIHYRAAGSRGLSRKSQSDISDSRHDGGLDSSWIYPTPGTNRLIVVICLFAMTDI